MGDVRRHPGGVVERRRQRLAQELARFVLAVEQRAHPLACIGDRGGRVDRPDSGRLPWTVLERCGIEREDLRLTVGLLHALVESLPGLLPGEAALEHLCDERGHHPRLARFLSEAFAQVGDDVAEDVHAGEIERSESRALRTSERRPGNRINLFRRVLARGHLLEDSQHAVKRDVVADEVRRVLRDHDALPEPAIGEVNDRLHDCRQRVRPWNDFEQLQVARRIEEMRAEPVTTEILAPSFGQRRDRNAGRVGADHRARAPLGIDLLEERAFHVQPLHDRLDDPVRFRDALQVFVEAARRDQLRRVRREKRVRLERPRALHPLGGCRAGDVEENRRHAGIGEMSGNLGAHGAGAEDRDGANHLSSLASAAVGRALAGKLRFAGRGVRRLGGLVGKSHISGSSHARGVTGPAPVAGSGTSARQRP